MLSPLFDKVAATVLAASLIGGGTAVLKSWHTNGVQDAKIAILEQRQDKTELLIDTLNETNRRIDVLNERLDWVVKESEREE